MARLSILIVTILVINFNISSAYALSASFKWCSGSPEFQISGAPKGTARLDFRMIDLNASFNHGGGNVAYNGQKIIECGSMNDTYVGPSPPNGSHTYEWSIKAIDLSGNILDKTTVQRKFPE
jgi:Phosphatidylethanolamine-binding protein